MATGVLKVRRDPHPHQRAPPGRSLRKQVFAVRREHRSGVGHGGDHPLSLRIFKIKIYQTLERDSVSTRTPKKS